MQNREQIQKEIDTVKAQLSFVGMAAETAPPADKENWQNRLDALRARLASLEKEYEQVLALQSDNAVPDDTIIMAAAPDAAAAPADATAEKDATDVMADAMFERILHADESEIPADEADALLNKILLSDEWNEKPKDATTADVMADAMVDNILFTPNADVTSAAGTKSAGETEPAAAPLFDDATADALLAQILAAEEESPAVTTAKSDFLGTPDEEQRTPPVYVTESDPIRAEAATVPPAAPAQQVREEVPAFAATAPVVSDDFAARLHAVKLSGGVDADTVLTIERLKMEAEDAKRRADAALAEAERLKKEAEEIKLAAETERAVYAAEMELQRGLRNREEDMRAEAERAEKERLSEKIARRKSEITAIRNDLQDVKDSQSAFAVREKLFAVQMVLDEEERNSPEISYLLTKSLDDVAHAVEVSELKRRIAAFTAARKTSAQKAAAAKKAAAERKKKAMAAAAKKAAAEKKKRAAAAKRKAAMRRRRAMMLGGTPRH